MTPAADPAGDLAARPECRAAGVPGEDALGARELASEVVRGLGLDADVLVRERRRRRSPGTIEVSMCFSPSRPCHGSAGCTLTHRTSGFISLRRRVTPMNVPLVPSAATKCVTVPRVCSQISAPVPS